MQLHVLMQQCRVTDQALVIVPQLVDGLGIATPGCYLHTSVSLAIITHGVSLDNQMACELVGENRQMFELRLMVPY